MAESTISRLDDAVVWDAWNRFVAGHASGSLLQTTQWGTLKSGFGWDWELVTVGDLAAPSSGAVVLFRRLPLGLGTIAYVPRGPLVDWSDADQVGALFQAIHSAARRRRAWACWLEPEALEGTGAERPLKEAGYRPAERTVQPRRTIWVDLALDEEAILMAMKSKTRYNIRLAARKDIVVRQGAVGDIEVFYGLMEETGERDAFGIHTAAYYRNAFELFAPYGQVALFVAEYADEPVAALLAFAVGSRAYYIAGASSNRHRERMPAYAAQWAAICWAKARGCTVYDLWGIPDANEETLEAEFAERSDGLWGVYRFKRGFGGRIVRYVGLWERSFHPLYRLAARFAQTQG